METEQKYLQSFDLTRNDEYLDLVRLINLAGKLNSGNHIVENIIELERLHKRITENNLSKPRSSFTAFLHEVMVHCNQTTGKVLDVPTDSP